MTSGTALIAAARQVPVEIPNWPLSRVLRKAIQHYNRRNPDKPPATMQSDPEFLKRIAVNWLRHMGSNYDAHRNSISALAHKEDRKTAGSIVKGRILAQIAIQYPQLADEARHQAFREDRKA
ncbi:MULTISPECIES: hypothetical protein [Corynebacterium]|uniref:hypothetical protein n=1 Tax=Corynebacterium TaxID=1716 RepID=UPI0011CBA4C5|nr:MULTISPECIES: hypothetical protein [Corynebacterium]MDK7145128.1 hypothetical protein [Corynebacterium amycolatum]